MSSFSASINLLTSSSEPLPQHPSTDILTIPPQSPPKASSTFSPLWPPALLPVCSSMPLSCTVFILWIPFLYLREEDRPLRAWSRRQWQLCRTSPGPAGPVHGPRLEPGNDRWRGDAAGRPDPSEYGCCSNYTHTQEDRGHKLQM